MRSDGESLHCALQEASAVLHAFSRFIMNVLRIRIHVHKRNRYALLLPGYIALRVGENSDGT